MRVSVDTRKASVAEAAVAAGATLVNDVSASLHEVAAAGGVGWVAMHMQGDPRTMQGDPRYDDVVDDVVDFLAARARSPSPRGWRRCGSTPGSASGRPPPTTSPCWPGSTSWSPAGTPSWWGRAASGSSASCSPGPTGSTRRTARPGRRPDRGLGRHRGLVVRGRGPDGPRPRRRGHRRRGPPHRDLARQPADPPGAAGRSAVTEPQRDGDQGRWTSLPRRCGALAGAKVPSAASRYVPRTSPATIALIAVTRRSTSADVDVATEADAHHARRVAVSPSADPLGPAADLGVVEPEQVGEVGVGAEAPAAHADAVLVAEDGGDEAVVDAVDGERDDADLRRAGVAPTGRGS